MNRQLFNSKYVGLILSVLALTCPVYAQETDPTPENAARPAQPDTNEYDDDVIERDYEAVSLFDNREISITTGFDYSSGRFNLPVRTNISYVPYSIKYTDGPLSLRASSGYISISSPRNIIAADDGVPIVTDLDLDATEQRRTIRNSGFGDVYLSATYSLENPINDDFLIDLTGRVKIPTANEQEGLGTGKFDYTIQSDFAYLLGDFLPFATLGYRFVGQSDFFVLQNTFFASIGVSYYLTQDTSFGVSYDYRESATPGFNSPKEIFGYMDIQLNDHWGFNLYGVAGLNNVTTDYTVGSQIRYKF